MRKVLDTDRKPERVLRATADSTECTRTRMMEMSPRPSEVWACSNCGVDGSGLYVDVRVSSRSWLFWYAIGSALESMTGVSPRALPLSSNCTELGPLTSM